MSEISNHQAERREKLSALFYAVMDRNQAVEAIRANDHPIRHCTAHDVIALVDEFVKAQTPTSETKIGINKFLNVLGKTIREMPEVVAEEDSLWIAFQRNSQHLASLLKDFKAHVKTLNSNHSNNTAQQEAAQEFKAIAAFEPYYTIKENVLFPVLEKCWPDFRCLQVMWSFHDDIRGGLKEVQQILNTYPLQIMDFNKSIGDLYFNMLAIKLREDKLLYPHAASTIDDQHLQQLIPECNAIGFPYFQAVENKKSTQMTESNDTQGSVDLATGGLTADQLILLFNHLPVDITYVDEDDKVRFFSDPPHRIFPRSKAIIGRDVHNCHPPESVHIVHQIIDNFRNGSKDSASFWINMKSKMIHIQYFALRDKTGAYKGVIEVSQEISAIKKLEGEQRLLDWQL